MNTPITLYIINKYKNVYNKFIVTSTSFVCKCQNIPLRDNIYSEVKIYAINNVNFFNHQFILPDGSFNDAYAVEPCDEPEPFEDSD